jgi:hypothetical protein
VAIILAIGISVSLVLLVVSAYLVRAVDGTQDALGANITEVLTGWGGGIIGVLGAYVGFSVGRRHPIAEKVEEKS